MQPAERLAVTLAGGTPDRIPVLPKIWFDLASALTGTDLRQIMADPAVALRSMVDAGLQVRADGIRALLLPARKTIVKDGHVYEVDDRGKTLGAIDIDGDLSTQLDRPEDFRLEDAMHMAFFNFWTHPEPRVKSMADVKRIVVPDKSFYESHGYGDILRALRTDVGDRIGLIGNCVSSTLAFHIYFRGLEQALIDLIDDPPLVHAIMERAEEFAIERGKFKIDVGFRILRLNDSVANMSVISPSLWKQFIFPHMKAVCDELHRYCPEVKIYCHICGNVLPVMESLVETGLDCIGPLDPLGGFTVAEARRAAGDEMVLMGGVDTQSFVHRDCPSMLQEARRCIAEGAVDGGRFVLGSGCMVPRNARRENLLALAEASADAADHPD